MVLFYTCVLIFAILLILQRFLNKLREDKALYLCPRGADDDLFWLYSTLYERPEGYKTTSLVITNDLMRDHKANAFDSGRVFVRWRAQHIVNFMVNYDDPEQGDEEAKPKERVSFYTSRKSTLFRLNCFVGSCNCIRLLILSIIGRLILTKRFIVIITAYFPAPFSREIQPSSTEGFWHVPSTDRNLWLCVKASPSSEVNASTSII